MARFTIEHNDFIEGPQGPQGQVGPQGPAGQDAVASQETDYQVGGGTVQFNGNAPVQPQFNGTPLFTASYIKAGNLVFFQIKVVMTNITNFGSGQYYMTLPFESKHDVFMRSGHLHDDSSNKNYAISGEILKDTNMITLAYTASNGQDLPFTSTSPITLTTSDDFHIAGTYICK